MGPAEAKLNLQRLVGKFSLFFALIYVQILIAAVVVAFRDGLQPLAVWLLLLVPMAAFVPAAVDAVKLHRTREPERLRHLWRRCGLLGVSGMALLMVAALVIGVIDR
ncbi:hypothetical protein QLQ12_06110 [Actinoplanes sp. NEAU-A12]|uniref:Uncharacterized protein n=1 Tax=Actinoplanes sandaracinus TaxID=3045177 RepID=A0ABT6WEL9_9ACTN|nr:hypothetical protein [Actinoplanes sandaracinus]MDI6098176.1 hypothetical protein [Actinoplanes sandaracinus]